MSSAEPKGPDTLRIGTFVAALLALAVNIAGQKVSGLYAWAPVACLAIVIGLWVFPIARRSIHKWVSDQRHIRQLKAEWPGFQVRLSTLRDFYNPTRPGSVPGLLRNGAVRKPSNSPTADAANDMRINSATEVLTLMDRLTAHLVTDARTLPESGVIARRIARDFELLLKVYEFQGIGAAIALLAPPPAQPSALEDFTRSYQQLRRDYLSFSREANARITEQIFDGD